MYRFIFNTDNPLPFHKSLGEEELERQLIWLAGSYLYPYGVPTRQGKKWKNMLDFMHWFDKKYPFKPYP